MTLMHQRKGEKTAEDEGQKVKRSKSAGGSELTCWTALLFSLPNLKCVSSAGVLNETTFTVTVYNLHSSFLTNVSQRWLTFPVGRLRLSSRRRL